MLLPPTQRPTWSEIDLNSLAFNFRSVKEFVGNDIRYMAVVKADAYGHGAVACAKRLEAEGVDWFGVAIPEEGVELRSAGISKPILCLGGFWQGQETLLFEYDLATVIYSTGMAESLNNAAFEHNTIAKIHLKIDTGMGRVGFTLSEIDAFIEKALKLKNLEVEGIMTHFAAADDLSENAFTNLQIERFNNVVRRFAGIGINPKYQDLANSPGAIAHQNSHGNMVRLGGVLYGLGGDVLPADIEKPELRPVMSLRTTIAQLKVVSKGTPLGYSKTFTTQRDSLIATIPMGYHDGLPRSLSNRGQVIINGAKAPIVGRISMDWTIIDVTEIKDVKVGDNVIVIGKQSESLILAEDLSRELGTISYEITCGISRRVPRVFVGN
jgi:alanine racemase